MRKLLLWIGIWACVQVAFTSCQQKRSNTEWIRLAEQMKDTLWIKELQVRAGRIYCFAQKDIQGYRCGCKPEGTYVIPTK